MSPKFANPHSLSQDAEITTRSEIAKRVGCSRIDDDEESHSLQRDLDNMLKNTWAGVLAQTFSSSRTKKRRKTVESHKDEDGQLVFRLVSSMKRPQHISLDPKPQALPAIRELECEDNEMQAQVRRIRAQSVAVEFKTLGETDGSVQHLNPKHVTVDTKMLLNAPIPRHLPPSLVVEEARVPKRVKTQHLNTINVPAPSPHEPRLSCVVLPVKSISDSGDIQKKKRRKTMKERPAPAYWRPSPGVEGKCSGYALGYPSSWAPDQPYVRDTMKRGVEST